MKNRFKFFIKNEYGFTLMEVIVTTFLTSIILVTLFGITIYLWDGVKISTTRFYNYSELKNGMYWIVRDLKRASNVVEAEDGKLVLELQDRTVVYELKDNKLIRISGNVKKITAAGIYRAEFRKEEKDGGVFVEVNLEGKGGKLGTCVWVYTGD
jgi:type II secretory pathway component PulJ